MRAQIEAARNKPNLDQRQDAFQSVRVKLRKQAASCTSNFVFLQGYINDAYSKDLWFIKYQTAGYNFFADASNDNWENVKGLKDAMIDFITANATELLANDNMPAAFATKVSNDASNFSVSYGDFKVARQTSDITADKISANNELYAELRLIMDDGRLRVFRNNAEKAKLFTQTDILFIISPPGSASLRVTITENGSNLPLVGEIVIQKEGDTPLTGKSDAAGVFVFENFLMSINQ